MKHRIGMIVIAIGILHTMLGLVKYAGIFGAMVSEGLINTAGTNERNLAIWFTFCGTVFIMLGYTMKTIEGHTGRIPSPLGWSMFASAVLGGLILPISGFWALIIPSFLIIVSNRK